MNDDDMPALTAGNTATNTATSLCQLDSINVDCNVDLPVDFPVLQLPQFDVEDNSGKPANVQHAAWSLYTVSLPLNEPKRLP